MIFLALLTTFRKNDFLAVLRGKQDLLRLRKKAYKIKLNKLKVVLSTVYQKKLLLRVLLTKCDRFQHPKRICLLKTLQGLQICQLSVPQRLLRACKQKQLQHQGKCGAPSLQRAQLKQKQIHALKGNFHLAQHREVKTSLQVCRKKINKNLVNLLTVCVKMFAMPKLKLRRLMTSSTLCSRQNRLLKKVKLRQHQCNGVPHYLNLQKLKNQLTSGLKLLMHYVKQNKRLLMHGYKLKIL